MSEKNPQPKDSAAQLPSTTDRSRMTAYLNLITLVLLLLGIIVVYSGVKYRQSFDLAHLSRDELHSLAQQIDQQLQEAPLLERRATKLLLNQTWMRVVIGIGVFAVLNVIAVTAHHIVQKVRRSTTLYRTVERVVSPF